jgi:hypothetical protein
MKAILDTSSLLAFVRYYLPFDKNGTFKSLIQAKFNDGEIVLLDKVVEEAGFLAKGIVIRELEFIDDKSKFIDTSEILPYRKFFNLLENHFCKKDVLKLKDLSEPEFELEKTKYLNNADAKLILYALKIKQSNPIIVTEETANANDNKVFRKIPDNCKHIDINCCTLPIFLKEHLSLDLSELLK